MREREMSLPIEEFGSSDRRQTWIAGRPRRGGDVGISSATLSRVENGHMPDLETFAKICKWLGRDPREFLGFEREEAAPPQAVVQFRKDRTVSRETAVALGELILAAQSAIRARAKLID